MPFGNRKNILEDLFSSVLSQFKKYHPSWYLKINYLGIYPSLKLRILLEKIFSIFLKLNITPNTWAFMGYSFECTYIFVFKTSIDVCVLAFNLNFGDGEIQG